MPMANLEQPELNLGDDFTDPNNPPDEVTEDEIESEKENKEKPMTDAERNRLWKIEVAKKSIGHTAYESAQDELLG